MIWRAWIRSARGDFAAASRLAARPLLDAQQHAWESGGHPGTLLAGAVTRSLLNALAGRAHIRTPAPGELVVMQDGERLTVRRMHLDAVGQPAPAGEFRVRFRTRMAPRLNQWFSWLTIPLFSGLPGFCDKTWLVDDATGFSAGIYHWQTVADAAWYARSPALGFMTRRSLPGTASYWVGPAGADPTRPWPPGQPEPGARDPAPLNDAPSGSGQNLDLARRPVREAPDPGDGAAAGSGK